MDAGLQSTIIRTQFTYVHVRPTVCAELESEEAVLAKRVARVLLGHLPQFLVLISRFRVDLQEVGGEGGTLTSSVVSLAQAVLPAEGLTKSVRIGLQATPVSSELVARVLGAHYCTVLSTVLVHTRTTVHTKHYAHSPFSYTAYIPYRPTLLFLYS